ncbi:MULTISPECIES: hydroxypyruvate isomerase family protein [unclassified Acinetobacter]|uniref:hydroxypyruvate isomerase family protein n=1 Tax=unclassified Acinetobacter TaxID=196816 RepID=UPI0035BA5B7E
MNKSNKINLGVNLSMIFTEVPLIERFALARQAGFDTVEVQFPYELSIDAIQQQLQRYQLELCLINVPAADLLQGGLGLACVPNKQTEFQQAVKQAVEYATVLNVPMINVLAGRNQTATGEQSFDCNECWQVLIENLKFTAEYAQKHGIKVVFELINGIDMPHFLVQNLNQVEQVLQQVQHDNLALQFDCYHIARIGENVADSLHKYMPHIGHIQFADSPTRHQPSTGELNFAEIFQAIAESDYQGKVCAEYRPQGESLQSFNWKEKFKQFF